MTADRREPESAPGVVLVTGAAGFIGSRLVEALVEAGHLVVAVDRDEGRLDQLARGLPPQRLRRVRVDVADSRCMRALARATSPAVVVHLAALDMIADCERAPGRTVDVNVTGLQNTLGVANRARFVLFASSADVYAPSATAVDEEHPTRPSSVYGMTKLLGERLVAEWVSAQPGRQATSMRIFNVYGPGDTNPHVIPDVLRAVGGDGPVRLGNVPARRDFIHVDDVVDLMLRVLGAADPPAVLNAGTGTASRVLDILALLQPLIGPFVWTSDAAQPRVHDREHLQADTARARALFPDFAPRRLAAGLADLVTSRRGLDAGGAIASGRSST